MIKFLSNLEPVLHFASFFLILFVSYVFGFFYFLEKQEKQRIKNIQKYLDSPETIGIFPESSLQGKKAEKD